MRKENTTLRTHFTSEAGSHLQNRDYFAFVELGNFACYVLADGIDEDVSESAKTAAMEAVRLFMEAPSMKAGRLRRLLEKVNELLLKSTVDIPLEASVMLLVTDYAKYRFAQAGNVRLCHIRNGAMLFESKDMSLSSLLADKGELSLDKVAEHIERHNLSAFLGQRRSRFYPHISGKRTLEDGDILALYSRGVWETVSAGDLLEASEGAASPEDFVDTVEDLITAPSADTIENYSFAVIFADKVYENSENRKKLIKKILMIGIPVFVILLAIGITLFVRHNMRQGDIEAMNNAFADAQTAVETNNFERASEKADEAHRLARKLKLPDEEESFSTLAILLTHIIAGDAFMREEKYSEAYDEFKAAEEKSYYSDLVANEYIARRTERAVDYTGLHDLLDRADAMLSDEMPEEARGYYLQAHALAAELRAVDEKTRALDGIESARDLLKEITSSDLKEQAALHEKRGDEYPEIAGEQYRLSAETYRQAGDIAAETLVLEKLDKLTEEQRTEEDILALALAQTEEANGDSAFAATDLALARSLYLSAQAEYMKQGLVDLSQSVGQKLLLVFQSEQDVSKERARADAYMADGDSRFVKGETQIAWILYQTALDIYEELGLFEDMDKARIKLDQANKKLESER
jgi:serine/threonine protein phosphatase PrpC